jgi:hypothetical protein
MSHYFSDALCKCMRLSSRFTKPKMNVKFKKHIYRNDKEMIIQFNSLLFMCQVNSHNNSNNNNNRDGSYLETIEYLTHDDGHLG